jgi:hypothetical protein
MHLVGIFENLAILFDVTVFDVSNAISPTYAK